MGFAAIKTPGLVERFQGEFKRSGFQPTGKPSLVPDNVTAKLPLNGRGYKRPQALSLIMLGENSRLVFFTDYKLSEAKPGLVL